MNRCELCGMQKEKFLKWAKFFASLYDCFLPIGKPEDEIINELKERRCPFCGKRIKRQWNSI